MASTKPKVEEWITGYKKTLLEGWAREGLSIKQIAANIGIGESNIYRWFKKSPEFLDIIKKNKEVSLYEVENSLYKSANGFPYEEVTYYRDPDTGEMIEAKRVHKFMKPDVTAQIFLMKTQRPERFSQKENRTVEDNLASAIDKLSDVLDTDTEDNSDAKP